MKTFLQSPILHFLVLGLVAFYLYEQFRPENREVIHITTQTIDALVQQRESIEQNPVTPELRQEIIEEYIEDEVLLREAYKRGFDKNDYRVRQRMLRVMRSSLSEVIPEPSVAQLRAYYDENRETYQTSASVSFQHVYFPLNSENIPGNPEEFLKQLNESDNPLKLGEFTMQGNIFTKSSFSSTASKFGKPFAEAVFDLPMDTWTGPIQSFQGIHYVRVTGHHDPEIPSFEELENYLRQDYLMKKARDSQQKKIDTLRKGYVVVVEGEEKD